MLGIIGGSGVYRIDGLDEAERLVVETPWGRPSSPISVGEVDGQRVAFLPRHGPGHKLDPASVPYRANIDALKRLGVTDLVSISACGSFREEMAPGHVVVVDQFIDRTKSRADSFFGPGCVAHVSLARPTCARLSALAAEAARAAGATVHEGGTYLAMEGPQFSTAAESRLYRSWGADVIGMTNLPEARLAREAELCYATLAMVTDYDAWREDAAGVEVSDVLATLAANGARALAMAAELPRATATAERPVPCPGGCDRALDHALMTAPAQRDGALLARLGTVAGRVL